MKCKVCGKEVPEYFRVCDACGADMTPPAAEPVVTEQPLDSQPITIPSAADLYDPISQKLSAKFGGAAFLIAAILFAVYSAISTFILGSLPIIEIIATVAMFMLYGKARAKADTYEYRSPLKMMSGIALAEYIIGWVIVGLFAVIGGLIALMGVAYDSLDLDMADVGDFSELASLGIDLETMLGIVLVVFGVVFVVIAIVCIFFNIFCIGRMRKCAKSFADSCESGVWFIEKLGAVRGWLITLGVFQSLSALSSLASLPAALMSSAMVDESIGIIGGADMPSLTYGLTESLATLSVGSIFLEVIGMVCMAVAFFLLASCAKEEEKIKF